MADLDRDCEPTEASCELADIMQVVMRVGVLMLRAGTVSFRVEQAMTRVALAFGVDRLDAYVTFTGITASIHRGRQHYTQIARVSGVAVDMNRLSAVELLSKHISTGTSPTQVAMALEKIEHLPGGYSVPFVGFVVAIACGAFASIQGGGITEFVCASVGSAFGFGARLYLRSLRLNLIPTTVVCSAIAILMCYLMVQAFENTPYFSANPEYAYISSVLFLVPGAPLVTAALDLIRFDLISGMSRITYALLLLFSIAIGIVLAGSFVNFSIL